MARVRREQPEGVLRPLDERDGVAREQLAEAEARSVARRLDAVEVEVEQQHAARVVLVDDRERRRRDVVRVQPEPLGDAFGEVRLARPEPAVERDDVARREVRCERAAERAVASGEAVVRRGGAGRRVEVEENRAQRRTRVEALVAACHL